MDCYLNGAPVGRPTLRSPQMVPTRFSPASGPFALTLVLPPHSGRRRKHQPSVPGGLPTDTGPLRIPEIGLKGKGK
jgi:hypothetical protein